MKSRAALLALILLLTMLPASAVLTSWAGATSYSTAMAEGTASQESVVALVISHADHELPGDDFVEIEGLWIKQSNYAGVMVGDDVYYCFRSPNCLPCARAIVVHPWLLGAVGRSRWPVLQ
jgi:hypothetical protein